MNLSSILPGIGNNAIGLNSPGFCGWVTFGIGIIVPTFQLSGKMCLVIHKLIMNRNWLSRIMILDPGFYELYLSWVHKYILHVTK